MYYNSRKKKAILFFCVFDQHIISLIFSVFEVCLMPKIENKKFQKFSKLHEIICVLTSKLCPSFLSINVFPIFLCVLSRNFQFSMESIGFNILFSL